MSRDIARSPLNHLPKHRTPATPVRHTRRIECLACGAQRDAAGTGAYETGECPRCSYLGWAFLDDLGPATRRLILNGHLARRRSPAPSARHAS